MTMPTFVVHISSRVRGRDSPQQENKLNILLLIVKWHGAPALGFVLALKKCLSRFTLDFPCGSAGKESACNVGDLDKTSGLGRSPGEGTGYPLQYSGLKNSMTV